MNISVVIPTCARPAELRACLQGLSPETQAYPLYDYEVVVSDDGPPGSAAAALAGEFPRVRFVPGPRRGPAANRNAGAAAATGALIVFLDDDCLPQPGLLAAYAAAFADPALLAAEGRIRPAGPRTRMDEEAPENETGGWFWSCNIALRRDYFALVGGFDEAFPAAAMEDVELRERIRRRGDAIRFVPGALVVHPLRRFAGWRAVLKRAEAHGIYVTRPSCHLGPPSYRQALHKTLRLLIRGYLPQLWRLRARGALRAAPRLALPLWSAFEMKKALRAARAKR